MPSLEIQSFGAGIQSVALAILNATGRVSPRADLAIFADPGSEEVATYELLPVYRDWLQARGYDLVTVKSRRGPLGDYIAEKSTVIPAHVYPSGAPGRRQCTVDWKITPVQQEARRRGADRMTLQLGISLDEFYRVRTAREPWVSNRYPLIDLGLTRADCRAIIEAEGLPMPPKSACIWCPYQPTSRWQWRAIERPAEFEECAQLEDRINERQQRKGKPPLYLSRTLQPLRTVVSGDQMTLDDAMDGAECEGVCFV